MRLYFYHSPLNYTLVVGCTWLNKYGRKPGYLLKRISGKTTLIYSPDCDLWVLHIPRDLRSVEGLGLRRFRRTLPDRKPVYYKQDIWFIARREGWPYSPQFEECWAYLELYSSTISFKLFCWLFFCSVSDPDPFLIRLPDPAL